MTFTRLSCFVFLLVTFITSQSAFAFTVIGQVDSLKGSVTAVDERGNQRTLRERGAIFEGDRVETGGDADISLELKDGTIFQLSENSAFSMDKFVYGKSREEDKLSAKILKGAFRFISGLVSKNRKDAMTVNVGITATIGIRGTNVGGELIGEQATIKLYPAVDGGDTAIEVYNEHGSVLIDEPGYGTVVADANTAPSPVRRMKLKVVDNIVKSMRIRTRFF